MPCLRIQGRALAVHAGMSSIVDFVSGSLALPTRALCMDYGIKAALAPHR